MMGPVVNYLSSLWRKLQATSAYRNITGGIVSIPNMNALAKQAYVYWREAGCSHFQACGVLSSIQGESSFNAKAVGDNHHAFGLHQWHADRADAIKHGCGIDVRTADFGDQLKAAHWEMTKGAETATWKHLMAATSAFDAAKAIVVYYERPANPVADAIKRGAYAEHWATYFAPIAVSYAESA